MRSADIVILKFEPPVVAPSAKRTENTLTQEIAFTKIFKQPPFAVRLSITAMAPGYYLSEMSNRAFRFSALHKYAGQELIKEAYGNEFPKTWDGQRKLLVGSAFDVRTIKTPEDFWVVNLATPAQLAEPSELVFSFEAPRGTYRRQDYDVTKISADASKNMLEGATDISKALREYNHMFELDFTAKIGYRIIVPLEGVVVGNGKGFVRVDFFGQGSIFDLVYGDSLLKAYRNRKGNKISIPSPPEDVLERGNKLGVGQWIYFKGTVIDYEKDESSVGGRFSVVPEFILNGPPMSALKLKKK